jgi:MYXO-CTERM domain-containing protein
VAKDEFSCGCRTGGGTSTAAFVLVTLLALVAFRRM